MSDKISINRKNPLRAILTDTLPYEIPIFFTNENLYREATSGFSNLPGFVKHLLTTKEATKPEVYLIQKGGGSFRQITIIHPSAQLRFAEFYGNFDSFIESACARSSCSLRFPSRVGSHFFQKQHQDDEETDNDMPEADIDPASLLPQRKWASTYFSYRRYSHIYKFFLSDEFSQLEKKYKFMLKIDIARCFESIYTHSIAWALRGKEFAKEHKNAIFFESEFDKIMRESNWGETAGIPIGPEVSRIFAEIVMQSVDLAIERSFKDANLDVETRRYVDDYFIFSNSEESLDFAKSVVEKCASKFNLHLNQSKTEIVRRPLIAKLAVARFRTMSAISKFMTKARDSLDENKNVYFGEKEADHLISDIRLIARENDTDYAKLSSPALAVIGKALSHIRTRINGATFQRKSQGNIFIESCLRVASFLYQKDIRSATTHKMAKIFYEASMLVRHINSSDIIFGGQIEDIVRSTLELSSQSNINGPEIINLLAAADSVCPNQSPISPTIFGLALGQDLTKQANATSLGYFDLVSALYFSRNKKSFNKIRSIARQEIERRILALGNKVHLHAAETMLFFDFVSCPYIDKTSKESLFSKISHVYGENATPNTIATQTAVVGKRLSFITWSGRAQLRLLLERRELQPAYDS